MMRMDAALVAGDQDRARKLLSEALVGPSRNRLTPANVVTPLLLMLKCVSVFALRSTVPVAISEEPVAIDLHVVAGDPAAEVRDLGQRDDHVTVALRGQPVDQVHDAVLEPPDVEAIDDVYDARARIGGDHGAPALESARSMAPTL